MPNDQMDLSAVMRGNDEHEKLALDSFMAQFFDPQNEIVCIFTWMIA